MKPQPPPATLAVQQVQQQVQQRVQPQLKQPSAARNSVTGEPRTPWCGMGLCGECRVQVEGVGTVLACLWPLTAAPSDG